MSRVAFLRAGYMAFCVAFLAMATTILGIGVMLFLALAAAVVAGLLFAFSQDELPRGAGLALLAYFGLTLLAFLASTPLTLGRNGDYFVNTSPASVFNEIWDDLVLAFPLMLGAAALASAWERERGPKTVLLIGLGASVVWAALSLFLVPASTGHAATDAARVQTANTLLEWLGVAATLVGAAGAGWAALRPDEYA